MTGEIKHVGDKTSDQTKIVGKLPNQARHSPEILGAAPAHGKTEILDRTTKQGPVEPDIHKHTSQTTESDEIRQAKPQPGQVQVRVTDVSDEQKREWERVRDDA